MSLRLGKEVQEVPRQSRVTLDASWSRRWCATALVALAALIVACSGPAGQPATAPARAKAPTAADLERGLQTLLGYRDLNGGEVGVKDGVKATAVLVFASWCRHCRKQLGHFEQLLQAHPQLRVLGVNYFEDPIEGDARVRAYLAENAPWLQVVRADKPLFNALGRPTHVPSLYLYDGSGRLVRVYLPPRHSPPTMDELRSDITALMSGT